MNKKYIFFGIVTIIVIMCFCLNISYNNKKTEKFNNKIILLEEAMSKDNNISQLKGNQNKHIAIVSICNNKTQAIVKKVEATSLDKAYEKAKRETKKYIQKNEYDTKLVKVDFAKDIQEISWKEFKTELRDINEEYQFRYGIILDYQDREDIILTEAELNSNKIIDYENNKIDIESLNTYLSFCNERNITELSTVLKKFTTISYFCDNNNEIYEIDSLTGQRKQGDINTKTIDEILNNSGNYLFNMVQDNGKFTYGYSAIEDKELSGYNILRHAGAAWALILEYDSIDEHKEKIDKVINYLANNVKYYNDEIAYIEAENNEIKLGGNALAIIAINEYTVKFEDTKYIDLLKKLGNGIISMQQENGGYVHILKAKDYSLKDEYRTVFYDGEATLALCKIYAITQDKKYLDAAEKSMKYFIENDYIQHSDHWISYAANEITKYVDNKEYYELGLRNISRMLASIKMKTSPSHTDFEMLMQAFELYNRMLERGVYIEYLEKFPIDNLLETIKYRGKFQLNSYLYPEVAMYLKSPERYNNTFYVRDDAFRIRIDDIQHSILGYYHYNKNFEEVENLLNNNKANS